MAMTERPDLLSRVRQYIDDNLPQLSVGDRLIVGLSGGADSVCLLYILNKLGFNCVAAHCNFHLRGAESDRDEGVAVGFAESLGCIVETIHFDVDSYIKCASENLSIEMACRELRYDWFKLLIDRYSARGIAVGHHADDNTETVLQNLFRGTGIQGLRGMLPYSAAGIIRPLLFARSSEIRDYLNEIKIPYIVDSTNLESHYRRNIIRNELLPHIRQYFPMADKGFATTIAALRETSGLLNCFIDEKRSVYCDSANGDIYLNRLYADYRDSAEYILYEFIKSDGFSRSQASDIIGAIDHSGARFISSSGRVLCNDRGVLTSVRTEDTTELSLCETFDIRVRPIAEFRPSRDGRSAFFTHKILEVGILSVRTWQNGDRIKPFGMKGSKLLSDVFNDAKLPISLRNALPLLLHDGQVIWVPGVRTSRLFMVKDDDKEFVEFSLSAPLSKRNF